MESFCTLLNLYEAKRKMNEVEKDALLTNLMPFYLDKQPSDLMELLIGGDFEEFKKLVSCLEYLHNKSKSR